MPSASQLVLDRLIVFEEDWIYSIWLWIVLVQFDLSTIPLLPGLCLAVHQDMSVFKSSWITFWRNPGFALFQSLSAFGGQFRDTRSVLFILFQGPSPFQDDMQEQTSTTYYHGDIKGDSGSSQDLSPNTVIRRLWRVSVVAKRGTQEAPLDLLLRSSMEQELLASEVLVKARWKAWTSNTYRKEEEEGTLLPEMGRRKPDCTKT